MIYILVLLLLPSLCLALTGHDDDNGGAPSYIANIETPDSTVQDSTPPAATLANSPVLFKRPKNKKKATADSLAADGDTLGLLRKPTDV